MAGRSLVREPLFRKLLLSRNILFYACKKLTVGAPENQLMLPPRGRPRMGASVGTKLSDSNELTTVVIQDSELIQISRMENIFSAHNGYFLAYCPFELPEFFAYCAKFEPCVAVVDVGYLEHYKSALPALLKTYKAVRLLVRGEMGCDRDVEELLLLGCWGLISTPAALDILRKAVDAITDGQFWVPRKLLSRAFRRVAIEECKISPREMEVLQHLAAEASNKSISQALYISPETLRWHLRNLYTKTGIRNRQALVTYARDLLGTPPPKHLTA
jgi:DNA-binding NarL/FixJ family response regulator